METSRISVPRKSYSGTHEGHVLVLREGLVCSGSRFRETILNKLKLPDFDKALGHFEKLHKADPLRVDHMDIYSNTLYIRQRHVELAELAHQIFDVDRYRYESCLIVGMLFSGLPV